MPVTYSTVYTKQITHAHTAYTTLELILNYARNIQNPSLSLFVINTQKYNSKFGPSEVTAELWLDRLEKAANFLVVSSIKS